MRSIPESYTIPPDMIAGIRTAIEKGYYSNRSALVREAIKRVLDELKTKEQHTNTQAQGQSAGAGVLQ